MSAEQPQVDAKACEHYFEFSSDTDEPEMKCEKCGEALEVIASSEVESLRARVWELESQIPPKGLVWITREELNLYSRWLQENELGPHAPVEEARKPNV